MLPKVILHKAVSLDGRTDNFERDILMEFSIPHRFEINAHFTDTKSITQFVDMVPQEVWDEFRPEDMEIKPDDERPILVVLDNEGKLSNWDKIMRLPSWRDHLVLCTKNTPQKYQDFLKENNIKYIVKGDNQVDIKAALDELGDQHGVKTVMLDLEGDLNSTLITEGLVDELSLIVYPTLVGGEQQKTFFSANEITTPDGAIKLLLKDHEDISNKLIWLHYNIIKKFADQKEMGDESIKEFVEMVKAIQSLDEFKEKRGEIFDYVEQFLMSIVESLRGLVNNPPAPDQVQEKIAKIQEYQETLTEVFEGEMERIAKLPGDSGYVSEFQSLMGSRLDPLGQEMGKLMEQLMSLVGSMGPQ